MSATAPPTKENTVQSTEMREFMLVVRRALLLVVRWIEAKYGI